MLSNTRSSLLSSCPKLTASICHPYYWWIALFGIVLSGLFAIAVYPEPPAKLLTPYSGWVLKGGQENVVTLSDIPQQYRQLRRSIVESPDARIFRTWTPSHGVVPIELTSAPFHPSRFMSIQITGTNRTHDGRIHTYIECEHNKQRLEFFRGSVNVNVSEAILALPRDWCPGNARLKFISQETNVNVGVGSVFKLSYISYLKSTFLGRVPYFFTALVVFSIVMFTGVSAAVRLGWRDELLPIAFVSLGVASLGVFYLASGIRYISIVVLSVVIIKALAWSGSVARAATVRELTPYFRIWAITSLVYFTVLCLTTNGLGHWGPNYRFWPATWSSDNELPWLFAEAIRNGWDLKGLFGGTWLPTDRPPLMAGSYLLVSDIFGWLQSGNDGPYLRGQAYNAVAVILNALWVPVAWWLLTTLHRQLNQYDRTKILVFVACLPFVLFNTVYGWPKAFGAAFALVAFGLAWNLRERASAVSSHSMIVLFFVLGAFSMLAHASTALFLAPLGLLFLWWTLRSNARSVVTGFGLALALLASWSIYKSLVLPSASPITKFALTGWYGFGHPDWTLWQMLSNRYSGLSLVHWLDIKKIMFLQAFLPLNHEITQIGLNSDFGAGAIDKLRAWDFMLLSKGNLAIPLFTMLAAWCVARALFLRRLSVLRTVTPFMYLIGISVAAWLVIVLAFLVPPVVPVWPQAALFGLALGGAVVVHERYPFIFGVSLLATISYTAIVWILSPLWSALAIDAGAALVLVVVAVWALFSIRQVKTLFTRGNMT